MKAGTKTGSRPVRPRKATDPARKSYKFAEDVVDLITLLIEDLKTKSETYAVEVAIRECAKARGIELGR